jgi:hypothetical protein
VPSQQQQEGTPPRQNKRQQQKAAAEPPPPPPPAAAAGPSSSTSDWLGRPLLPPDADPHTGGSMLDVVLMCASLAILVFLSMELYRLFAFTVSPAFSAWRETSAFF